jgi:hypothetical protein
MLENQGEDKNCFGKQQHGSCPDHQAINAVHMKTLTYDLTRILWVSLIMFDNDATGCFDRIIVALAMIAALWLGMPHPAAWMHSSALIHMKYFVKMAHGVSEAFYWVLWDFFFTVQVKAETLCKMSESGIFGTLFLKMSVVITKIGIAKIGIAKIGNAKIGILIRMDH